MIKYLISRHLTVFIRFCLMWITKQAISNSRVLYPLELLCLQSERKMENATHLLLYSMFRSKRYTVPAFYESRCVRRVELLFENVVKTCQVASVFEKWKAPFQWVSLVRMLHAPIEYLNRNKLSSSNVAWTVLLSNINVESFARIEEGKCMNDR